MILLYTIPLILSILVSVYFTYQYKLNNEPLTVKDLLLIIFWIITPGLNMFYSGISLWVIIQDSALISKLLNKRIL